MLAGIHNSNYASTEEAKAAIDRYFDERNEHFRLNPKRAGNRIWGVSGTQPFLPIATTAKILGIDEGRSSAGPARSFDDRPMTAAPQTRFAKDHFRAAEIHSENTANPSTQWIYSSVFKTCLQKTGVFLDSAGDFREFLAEKVRTPVSGDFRR